MVTHHHASNCLMDFVTRVAHLDTTPQIDVVALQSLQYGNLEMNTLIQLVSLEICHLETLPSIAGMKYKALSLIKIFVCGRGCDIPEEADQR